jgi:hypothetical protein
MWMSVCVSDITCKAGFVCEPHLKFFVMEGENIWAL